MRTMDTMDTMDSMRTMDTNYRTLPHANRKKKYDCRTLRYL